MKQIGLLTILLLLSHSQQSCQSRQQETSKTADSATVASNSETASTPAITGRLAELGLTSNSHWRGVNLGDDFTKVKATEKGEPFESDAKHTGYTIELSNLESADVLYYQTAKKVSAIDVDLFLNSRQSVTVLQKELSTYFANRYGTSKPKAGGAGWTGQKGESVLLKDVSKGKDFGLTVKIGDVPKPNEGLEITKHEWDKEIGTIAVHDLIIKNMSLTSSYKDITVKFRYFGPSGTELNARNEIIYQIIKPGKTISVKGLNTGFVNQQAATCKVEIVGAKLY